MYLTASSSAARCWNQSSFHVRFRRIPHWLCMSMAGPYSESPCRGLHWVISSAGSLMLVAEFNVDMSRPPKKKRAPDGHVFVYTCVWKLRRSPSFDVIRG
eukprot:s738_g2.t1